MNESAELLFESCERRLVLSAQLLFDVLGDQALEMHGAADTPSFIPIEAQLQEAHAATGLDAARAQFGLTGAGQTVAVIDSGIAWDHVALGQGFGPGYRVVGGWDFTEENDARPYDDGPAGFHGTHVSGIIGSDDPNHTGVAPDVDLVALRVFNDFGQGQLSWIENALQWVHQNKDSFENPITTVNLSVGTLWNGVSNPEWAILEDELKLLYDDGIFVSASAGNSFADYNEVGLSYPASSQYVLPVASLDENGQISDFSQRSDRVLAAPGTNVISTVPDHVLGRDGKIEDFVAASGTSMASPYVAGASVLVRQAMEMTGWESISAATIADHLRGTADSVFDSITGLTYDSLNLENAIGSLIPDDTVGDAANSALQIDLSQSELDLWINRLGDTDVFRFVANATGTLTLDASSDWLESLNWSIQSAGQTSAHGGLDPSSVQVVAGRSYELYVSAGAEIGPASFSLDFAAAAGGGGGGTDSLPPSGNLSALGTIQYFDKEVAAGQGYSVVASQSGTFTVQWTNHDAPTGDLFVTDDAGRVLSSAAWSDGVVRLDVQVKAGDQLGIFVPGSGTDQGELAMANVLQQAGDSATVNGTLVSDDLSLDLSNGVHLSLGVIDYTFDDGSISQLQINGFGSNDRLEVLGSSGLDKVDLRPTGSLIENGQIRVDIASVEEISYRSGGGADRVYLYDSDSDDTLTARPGEAELIGVGYRFTVAEVERIFIHATGGGQDFAYLYDSAGNDRLSVRPQFTSIAGDGFFNYVRGFERVYAYANQGGTDVADLYDSVYDDRFTTSGVSASIVGPGFSSFTRSFEQVNAHASAGGNDLATLYAENSQTLWQAGSDFISFDDSIWSREARGFDRVETYVASQPIVVSSQAVELADASLGYSRSNAQSSPHTESVEGVPAASPAVPAISPLGNQLGLAAESSIEPHRVEALPDDLVPIENRSSDWLSVDLMDQRILRETLSIGELLAGKLHLPEERLLDDPELEQNVLDEAFRQFSELF